MTHKRNPFPGMNPYLESRWGDVHVGLCVGIRSALQQQLPAGLRARAERRVVLEAPIETDSLAKAFRPDIAIIETAGGQLRGSADAGVAVATVAEPLHVRVVMEEIIDRWVEIIDVHDGNRLVTAIEVLSPSNKRAGQANEQYRQKLSDYSKARVNIVELDFLRSQRSNLIIDSSTLAAPRRCDYLACVNRADKRYLSDVYPISLREPLPTIAIPCRATDPDVVLPLQPLIDQIYVEGGHDDIDYGRPLANALSSEDAEWAAHRIRDRQTNAD